MVHAAAFTVISTGGTRGVVLTVVSTSASTASAGSCCLPEMTASKPAHPPGWDPSMAKPVAAAPMSKTAKKNEARKKKRDAEAATALTSGEDGPDIVGDVPAAGDDSSAAALASLRLAADGAAAAGPTTQAPPAPATGTTGDAEDGTGDGAASSAAKRAKALKKKLKAIEALQADIDAGKVAAPSPEQLEKLARREEVVAELAQLEG